MKNTTSASSKLNKDSVTKIMPVSSIQQGLLFHYLQDPSSSLYREQVSLTLSCKLSEEKISSLLENLTKYYPPLRSLFRWEQMTQPVAIFLKNSSIPFQIFSCVPAWKSDEGKNEIKKISKKLSCVPFQLNEAPLIRLALLQHEDNCSTLIWDFHHIILDGWSFANVLKKFFKLYFDENKNDLFLFDESKVYEEYAKWLKFFQEQKQQNIKFWEKYLNLFLEPTPLPLPFQTDLGENINNNIVSLKYSFTEKEKNVLMEGAKALKITLTSLFSMAWGLLLQRYTGRQDVVFGLTSSGRPIQMPFMQELAGMFIQTLPVRFNYLDEDKVAFCGFDLQKNLIQAREHELTALVDIANHIKIPAQELFKSILVFENHPIYEIESAFKNISCLSFSSQESNNYPLTIGVMQIPSLEVTFEINSSQIDKEIWLRVLKHYVNALLKLCEPSLKTLGEVEFLLPEEKMQILKEFNNTEDYFPENKTVAQLFIEAAKRSPERIAVEAYGQKLSYADLNKQSDELAYYLNVQGIGRGSIVALLLDATVEMPMAILAILKAGAAYLPIDCQYPKDRISHILQDSKAVSIISTRDIIEKHEIDIQKILLDEFIYREQKNIDFNLNLLKPHDLAYVIYTSGSTGKPKGVMVSHLSFTEFVTWAVCEYDHSPGKKTLSVNSYAFDSSIQQIFPPLISEETLVILRANDPIRFEPKKYISFLKEHKINSIDEVPTLMNALFDALDLQEEIELLPELKNISLGSEYVPVKLAQNCRKYLNHNAKIINGYGPAEASVETTTYHFLGNKEGELSLIGKPRRNLKVYILDENRNLCPIGVAGEICISGVGLALGYLNNPELTALKFFPNKYGEGEHARLYATGDLGKWLSDGNLQFIGRKDEQIKIRGYQVECKEVEVKIASILGVHDVVVMSRQDENRPLFLSAYIIADKTITEESILIFLKKKLPDYMIPSYFVFLEKFPLTANSKVDKKSLPSPFKYEFNNLNDNEIPKNETVEKILQVWKETLKHDKIDFKRPFFENGGNSILLISLLNGLQKKFPNTKITISDLFQFKTISEQAELLSENYNITKNIKLAMELKDNVKAIKETNAEVAIIGMSASLPEAESTDSFFQNLLGAKVSIKKIPESRQKLIPDLSTPMSSFLPSGFIEGVDLFEPLFFNVNPQHAFLQDPHHRLLLEHTYAAIENAGYNIDELKKQTVGVFIADILPQYHKYLDGNTTHLLMGNLPSYLAGRVAYTFGFCGPALNVDTACSSGLAAVHLAVKSIQNGECDVAIVGGVNVEIDPYKAEKFILEAGVMSPSGSCSPFSDAADGTLGGEGVIVFVLKKADIAVSNNDNIHIKILGSAMNQDGDRSNGITAPSPIAQAEVMQKAWKDANIDPTEISVLQAHGTGTKLGDPIEIQGINVALQKFTERKEFIPISSVKANIGHLDSAAGLAGLLGLTLSLKNKYVLPCANLQVPNSLIPFSDSPVYLPLSPVKLKSDKDHIGGVSSFGLSGTNVHLVCKSHTRREKKYFDKMTKIQSDFAVLLSAQTVFSLNKKVKDLIQFIESNSSLSIEDISYTLAVGRKHFSYRFAFNVNSLSDLLRKLKEVNFSSDLNKVKSEKVSLIDNFINTEYIILSYLAGDELQFNGNINGNKIPLPTYPHEKKSYWFLPNIKTEIAQIKKNKSETFENSIAYPLPLFQIKWKKVESIFDENSLNYDKLYIVYKEVNSITKEILNELVNNKVQVNEIDLSSKNYLNLDFKPGSIILFLSHLDFPYIQNIYSSSKESKTNFDLQENFMLIQNWMRIASKNKLKFFYITSNAFSIESDQIPLSPERQAFSSFMRTYAEENDSFYYRHLDFCILTEHVSVITKQILSHIDKKYDNQVCAYRNKSCFQMSLVHMSQEVKASTKIRPNGTYVITGGSGGISFEICKYFYNKYNLNFALILRTSFPKEEQWENYLISPTTLDTVKEKIRSFNSLKQIGVKFKVFYCDIENSLESEKTFKQIQECFGTIDGIFHTAGVAGSFINTDELEYSQFLTDINAKVIGTQSLEKIYEICKPDFIMLFSSMDGLFAEHKRASYVFANAYMDGFAQSRQTIGKNFISVRWGAWKNIGMRKAKMQENISSSDLLTVASNINVTKMFLGFDGKVACSLIEPILFSKINGLIATEIDFEDINILKKNSLLIDCELDTYIGLKEENYPASGEWTEENLIHLSKNVWKEILALEEINNTDDFFDLGGSSIEGLEISMKMSEILKVSIGADIILRHSVFIDYTKYLHTLLQNRSAENKDKNADDEFEIPEATSLDP